MHILRLNANAWPIAQAQIFEYGIMKNFVAVCKQILNANIYCTCIAYNNFYTTYLRTQSHMK